MNKDQLNDATAPRSVDQQQSCSASHVAVRALWAGDRFRAYGSLWTYLGAESDADGTARKHSEHSIEMGDRGYGYMADSICTFERDVSVEFVEPNDAVHLHRFVRPFRLQKGKVVEQPANTRKLRRNDRARSTDLAWTLPQEAWLPVEKYLIGRPAYWFNGVVRPNDQV